MLRVVDGLCYGVVDGGEIVVRTARSLCLPATIGTMTLFHFISFIIRQQRAKGHLRVAKYNIQ